MSPSPMRKPFGPWVPDMPPMSVGDGLTVCRDVVPIVGGYGPFGSLTQVDAFALAAAPRGAFRGALADGANYFIAGTSTNLYRKLESGWSLISNPVAYTPLGPSKWRFKAFGSIVFAANLRQPLQSINLASETVFSDVADAPRAALLEVAENFLWTGDVFEPDLGVLRNAVHWSAINNPRYWPNPSSDDATAALSGRQILEGDGGFVHALVAGAEVMSVFQERAIWRADFVGNDVVWQFNRMEADHGCWIQGAAIAVERGVFFLAADGFRLFDYTHSRPLGKGRVNDWFFADFDENYPDSLSMARDPVNTRVYVSYAARDATSGIPNRILVWDYVLDQFSVIYPGSHYELLSVGPITASLDSPDIPVTDPDLLEVPPFGVQSFDDRTATDGRIRIGAFTSAFRLGQFTGTPPYAVLETGDIELSPTRHSQLKSVRPQIDGEETQIQVASWIRRANDVTDTDWSLPINMARDGACYTRHDGRFHRLRFILSPIFTKAVAYDLEFRTGGTG